ncbi:DNA (cytosine-5)-methyltransferase DRM2-like isoform X2 [Magnolia sinica]|uniref:DNA (cytosine-5)-methyltransferase DRM2-like isoform X2 n=1 Tax=Magnolia sinica TaxID=86752 RepID=UPI00265A6E52|nr:DNA (cytosine-5)-methyltransferase DRM2-like isoform X2 [Magnolia sinica]
MQKRNGASFLFIPTAEETPVVKNQGFEEMETLVVENQGFEEMDGIIDLEGEGGEEIATPTSASSTCASVTLPARKLFQAHSASSSCSKSKLIAHFVGMGFSEDMVAKAIDGNGEGDAEGVLETLLAYSVLEKSSPGGRSFPTNSCSSEIERFSMDEELPNVDSWLGNEETKETFSGEEQKLLLLVEMGFSTDEAASAMDRCGPDASLVELTDSIYAAQIAKASEHGSSYLIDDSLGEKKSRKWLEEGGRWEKKINFRSSQWEHQKNIVVDEDNEPVDFCIPANMTGFGVPDDPWTMTKRKIPEAAIGPPYFYYENVASTPKGVWKTISRFLYDIEPEFVDSKHFCAATRKRGYIHNLPIYGRFPLQPVAPRTIHEALPMTKKWWPLWDPRKQLNCLQTCIASAKLTERIRSALAKSPDPPPQNVQQYVLNECRKWNLVWVGVHKVAPLEPDEIEMLLGFPRNHTRGGGISRTERYKSLGNSFQVDTVAYHLSILKCMFPNGITVLSLFSGIGGAEVALHQLGIPLKTVVSVEISEINRNILRSWWEQTNQTGNLIHIEDVRKLNSDRLEQLINTFGGFDLIIGGSPCNNLAGSNRVSRDGLGGEHSILFYDYYRILDLVKAIMGRNVQ